MLVTHGFTVRALTGIVPGQAETVVLKRNAGHRVRRSRGGPDRGAALGTDDLGLFKELTMKRALSLSLLALCLVVVVAYADEKSRSPRLSVQRRHGSP